jgi:hypothetical protein
LNPFIAPVVNNLVVNNLVVNNLVVNKVTTPGNGLVVNKVDSKVVTRGSSLVVNKVVTPGNSLVAQISTPAILTLARPDQESSQIFARERPHKWPLPNLRR